MVKGAGRGNRYANQQNRSLDMPTPKAPGQSEKGDQCKKKQNQTRRVSVLTGEYARDQCGKKGRQGMAHVCSHMKMPF